MVFLEINIYKKIKVFLLLVRYFLVYYVVFFYNSRDWEIMKFFLINFYRNGIYLFCLWDLS